MNDRLPVVLSLLLLISPIGARASVCDGWGGGNCSDAHFSSSSSGGSSGFGGTPVLFDGHVTQRGIAMVQECGPNVICGTFRAMLLIPLGLMFDVPVYTVKGVGYGLYYGGVGIGKGAVAVAHGVAYPFHAMAQSHSQHQWQARQPVRCGGSTATFAEYRDWEQCKRAILKRQHALTKNDPSNKDNELWCKVHVPLAESPNRAPWEERCNPGADANPNAPAAVESVPPVAAPQPPDAGAQPPPSTSKIGSSVPQILQNTGSTLGSGGFDGAAPRQ